MQKIVVSNIRFPEDEWLTLKSAAAFSDMSINEYLRYLNQNMAIQTITAIKRSNSKKTGYEAMSEFINRKRVGRPMGLSEEDEAIYGD